VRGDNAYVSGMLEDLQLQGNRLNYLNAVCMFDHNSCLVFLLNYFLTRLYWYYCLPDPQ
jgi:hypothetical protein